MTTTDRMKRPRHTPRTWLVKRRFRHWQRPKSLAGPKAEQYLDLLVRTLGAGHPDTLRAREQLAFWLSREGDPAGALRLTEVGVADRTTEFGPDHPDTLSARGSVVRQRRTAGDLPGAIADAQVLVEDMTRALGPDHRDTHEQRRLLAYSLSANGETAEAVRRLTALFADVEALGPTRQSDLRIVRTSLARELERNGDLTGALALVEGEIAAERSTIYGIDENLGQHPLHRLEDWRDRLAAEVRRKRQRP